MSAFYAYITAQTRDDNTWRVVMAFADSATAEWWRAISGANNSPLADIRRINPWQTYIYNAVMFNILNFYPRTFVVALFSLCRMITVDIILNQTVTDLVNGNWFYVRSKVDTTMYCHHTGRVAVSKSSRTMFRAAVKNILAKTIMIGSDSVTLTIWPEVFH
uniref:Uncharacterized protein n=1 Tax=Moniliophthora roreri TaxID=221103 RepID=A0A0W0G4L6_MONRR